MDNFVLDVQEESTVNDWKVAVEALNNRTITAVETAFKEVEDFRNCADGDVFDALLAASIPVIQGTAQVLDGFQKIFDAVTDLVSKTTSKIEEWVDGVKTFKSAFVG